MPSKVAALPPSAEVIYPAPFVIALLFREIFADPSKETPAMVRAVANFVAVAAFPVQEPDEPVVFWLRVGTLAAAIVPDDILLAFKLVKLAPLP